MPRPALPMRLTRLRVKNFRSIADIDIPLSPLTVLVGPNGSGKSNVVDVLRFVRDVFARGLDQAVMDREGMGVIQRWGTEGIEIGVTVELAERVEQMLDDFDSFELIDYIIPGLSVDYSFKLSPSLSGDIKVDFEQTLVTIKQAGAPVVEVARVDNMVSCKIGYSDFYQIGKGAKAINSDKLLLVSELLNFTPVVPPYEESDDLFGIPYGNWDRYSDGVEKVTEKLNELLFYTLNPNDLRQPQQVLKEVPFDEFGRNMAAVLRRLLRTNELVWENFRSTLASAVVGFTNIAVEPVGGYLATKLIYQTDTTQPRTSYIGQESDGTIRMLGLLAALYQDPAQPFLSIEEPEANIHPGALAVLASVLDEASLRSQILVTTHSPDMLDHLPAESFLVVEKVGDTTHVGPLDASQLASVRKRLFTPGELLRMEGLHRQPPPTA